VTSGAVVEQRLLSEEARRPLDIARSELPPPLRPAASLGLLDISEYFSETSGGVRTYLMQKARYVERRPWLRQAILVPGREDAIVETEGVRCYRLRGPQVPFHPSYRFMLATRSTSRIVAHERPDVIEVGSNYFAPWLVRRARRRWDAPTTWFFHANLPRVVSPNGPADAWPRRAAARLLAAYSRAISDAVDCTIVASDVVRRDLAAMGVEKVARVPLGVDLELHHPRRRGWAGETRRRLGLPEGPLALYLGRFSSEKYVDLAVRAWPAVHRRTGASLLLVGAAQGPHRIAADPAAGILVRPFERDRELVADLHAAADIYVAPGHAETFGLAALEALASGTPVLAADAGGVTELVERSGAGRTFRANVPGSLAEEAVALLADDLGALGARGRAYAEAEHDWDGVFDRLFAVYRGLAGS
jgi:alpha-1,6-mannosyltransferase